MFPSCCLLQFIKFFLTCYLLVYQVFPNVLQLLSFFLPVTGYSLASFCFYMFQFNTKFFLADYRLSNLPNFVYMSNWPSFPFPATFYKLSRFPLHVTHYSWSIFLKCYTWSSSFPYYLLQLINFSLTYWMLQFIKFSLNITINYIFFYMLHFQVLLYMFLVTTDTVFHYILQLISSISLRVTVYKVPWKIFSIFPLHVSVCQYQQFDDCWWDI